MSELRVYIEGNYVKVRNGASGDIDTYLLSDTGLDYNVNSEIISIYDRSNKEHNKKAFWSDIKDINGITLGANSLEVSQNLSALIGSSTILQNITSVVNTSITPLNDAVEFVGSAELNDYSSISVSVKTDQDGILYIDFSPDGTNWDSTLSFQYINGQINAPKWIVKLNRYARVRFLNDSGFNQSFLRLYTYYSYNTGILVAPINGTLSDSFDAMVTRPTNYESEVAMGKRQGRNVWNKFGYNLSVNVGTELVASQGGTYDPNVNIMSVAQTFTITYNNATDGLGNNGATSLIIIYLDENFISQTGFHTLSNTGSDVTAFTGLGINRATVLSNGGAGWNVNDITITATTDTTTQAQIPALGSVTQQCVFHTQINHTFLADYLRFKILKPSGGGSGSGYLVGYSWSRVTNTRYDIFRESYATSANNDTLIEVKASQKFPIGGREVLYFVLENNAGNNTEVEGRFSGIEERVS